MKVKVATKMAPKSIRRTAVVAVKRMSSAEISSVTRASRKKHGIPAEKTIRRKQRKSRYALFPSRPVIRERPTSTLKHCQKFVEEHLAAKVSTVLDNINLCQAVRRAELQQLEKNILTRLGIIGNLQVRTPSQARIKRKLIQKLEEALMRQQRLIEKWDYIVGEERVAHFHDTGDRMCCYPCVRKQMKIKI